MLYNHTPREKEKKKKKKKRKKGPTIVTTLACPKLKS